MNKREQIIQELLSKMFEFAGYPIPNQNLRQTKKEWYDRYQMSNRDKLLWMDWGTDFLQKEFGLPKERAKTEMEMLVMTFGLKTY